MDTESILQTARLLVEEFTERIETPTPTWMSAYLRGPQDVVTAAAALRVKRLGYLSTITALDVGTDSEQLELLYHFCTGKAIISLRIYLPKSSPVVPSLSDMIPSAESFEREIHEMFGVDFTGLRNIAHLYLPENWQEAVFPLRKEFDPRQESLAT
jgi:NADH:ubiquinone oxidoreductase subunit C